MNLMSMFKRRASAPIARNRLQILLAHERGIVGGEPDLVANLREQIMALVARHASVDQDQVQVRMNRGGALTTLEIEVELPGSPARAAARA